MAGIPGLLDGLRSDTRNVLLTFARIWSTLATGGIMSKDAAADWALAQLPPEHRAALEHARQPYLNCPYSEESWSDALRARVGPHVDHVLAEIDRLRTRAPRMRGPLSQLPVPKLTVVHPCLSSPPAGTSGRRRRGVGPSRRTSGPGGLGAARRRD